MWWAGLVYTLAKGNITRESEEFILWELPLGRALAYQHCAFRANALWTVPVERNLEESIMDSSKHIARHLEQDESEEMIGDDFES